MQYVGCCGPEGGRAVAAAGVNVMVSLAYGENERLD